MSNNKLESIDLTEPIISEDDNNIDKEKIKTIIASALKINNKNSNELINSLINLDMKNINGILYDIKSKGINFDKRDIEYLEKQSEEVLKELLAYNSLDEENYIKYKSLRRLKHMNQ